MNYLYCLVYAGPEATDSPRSLMLPKILRCCKQLEMQGCKRKLEMQGCKRKLEMQGCKRKLEMQG